MNLTVKESVLHSVIAFDIGGSQSRIALFEQGQLIWRNQAPTPSQLGPDAMVETIVKLYRPFAQKSLPVGVAITGQLTQGRVTGHNVDVMPGWQSYPLQAVLTERLQQPVQIYNDARAAAWGEYQFGTGAQCSEFLFLTVSTGIGAGLVLNGRLHIAANGFDAEIGEMLLADGVTLENYASGTALGHLAQRNGFDSAKHLCDAADAGDVKANELYQSGIAEVAKKLTDLAVMLGIQRAAVGGSVGLRSGYLERLRSEMQRYPAMYQFELVPAALGADAGLFGVAALASAE